MALIKLPSVGSGYISNPRIPTGGGGRIRMKVKVRFTQRGHRLQDHMVKWKRAFLFRAGASLRVWIIRSMKRRKGKVIKNPKYPASFIASPPGTPPFAHLKKSEFLKAAILFAVDFPNQSVVVGVSRRNAGLWGQMHEFGGVYKENHPKRKGKKSTFFHKRPFVKPAGEKFIASDKPSGYRAIMKDTKMWAYK